MKIILEFNDDEKQLAEQAYRGSEYAMAAEDFRTYLRNVIKHEEYSEETGKYLTNVQQAFYDLFEGLLDD
jgi:hypothetical protein